MVEISAGNISTLLADEQFKTLLSMYEEECGIPEYQGANPSAKGYEALDKAGLLHVFCARSNGVLVGFLSLMVYEIAHFSQLGASIESFYVLPNYRDSGTGKKLLELAENAAKERGAKGVFMSARSGSRLEVAARGLGYRVNNIVFFKPL